MAEGIQGPVLISGATGLIGTALAESLEKKGVEVLRFVRKQPHDPGEVVWATADRLSLDDEQPLSAVVHLAGEPIMGLWTEAKKRKIAISRIGITSRLCRYFAQRELKPSVMVCASAVGFYGERGDEVLTEDSKSGEGFLASTCREWEAAVEPALMAGIRVALLRTGIVFSKRGGAFQAMLTPFKLGLGSRLGSGKQWVSWIALRDHIRAIEFLMERADLSGPFNLTAPNPATNAELTRELAAALHRPTFIPIPEFVLKLAPGGFGEETLLVSQRVLPKKLEAAGFKFELPELKSAIAAELSQ
jgi:uncharacterized protein (TIGR01777 family)